jgi:hypothetical protein
VIKGSDRNVFRSPCQQMTVRPIASHGTRCRRNSAKQKSLFVRHILPGALDAYYRAIGLAEDPAVKEFLLRKPA